MIWLAIACAAAVVLLAFFIASAVSARGVYQLGAQHNEERARRLAEYEAKLDKRSAAIRSYAEEREHNLSVQRLSMENAMAERERMWAEERRELLDRIQVPGFAAARAFDSWSPTGQEEEPEDSDTVVDNKYAELPDSRVEWDADLAPIPGVDPEIEE